MARKTKRHLSEKHSYYYYKKLIISFLALNIIFFASAFSSKYTPALPTVFGDTCYMENDAFQVGEEVTYKLYYNLNFIWIPAGEAIFRVAEKEDQY